MDLRRRTKTAVLSALTAAALAATTLAAACSGDGASPETPAQVAGKWSTDGATLPVMSLDLAQTGAKLTGKVRLSGVEVDVTGNVTGSQIRLEDARTATTDSYHYIITARLENETTMKAAFEGGDQVQLTLTRQ